MVEFYKLLLTILTITIGFLNIALLLWKQKININRVFQFLATIIVLFNLWLIFSLTHQSIILHFRSYFSSNAETIITYSYFLIGRIIQLFMVYNVVLLVWEILPGEQSALKKKLLKSIIFFFGVLLLVGYFIFLFTGHKRFFLLSKEAIATIVQWGSLIYMILLVRYALGINNEEKRLSLIFVGISWILFLIAIIFLSISGYLGILTWLFNLPVEITLDFIITCIILLWIWKFSHSLTDDRIDQIDVENNNMIEVLVSKYELTKREQEIVELICKGSPNQEIADKLFVSLRTVKAHIYNIFKKTGVKNRLQLANVFRKYF